MISARIVSRDYDEPNVAVFASEITTNGVSQFGEATQDVELDPRRTTFTFPSPRPRPTDNILVSRPATTVVRSWTRARSRLTRMGHTAAPCGARERSARDHGLDPDGIRADHPDRLGFTALHLASQKHAVDGGAHVDPVDAHGNTPLFTAVFNSRAGGDVIAPLRRHGADPLHRNGAGNSPVALARLIGNHGVARLFADLP
jgi:uncharacterized protein